MRVRPSIATAVRMRIQPDGKTIRRKLSTKTLPADGFTTDELSTMRRFVANCGREVPTDSKQLVIAARECLLEIERRHRHSL